MIKIIFKFTLIYLTLLTPIHFLSAELELTSLEKKHKIYEVIKDIRNELYDNEHSRDQVTKSHKLLNKTLLVLKDEYEENNCLELEQTNKPQNIAPPTPTITYVSDDATANESVSIHWDNCYMPPGTLYEVMISEDLNNNLRLDSNEYKTVTTWTPVGNVSSHRSTALNLKYGKAYFISLRAKNRSRTGDYSSFVSTPYWKISN